MPSTARNMKISILLCVLMREIYAELPEGLLSIAHWQEGLDDPRLLFDRENAVYAEGPTEQVKRIAGPEDSVPQPRLLTRSLCSCKTQYEIRDLGEGHYPRYLTASRCKPKTCQSKFNSCRLLHYTVHVLRQRAPNGSPSEDSYADEAPLLPETPLPESLRHKWQLKPMLIAVACVPMPESRRN